MVDKIEKTIELNVPIERVWRALTDHREFGTWFGVRINGPFAPGQPSRGQITIEGFDHVPWNAEIRTMEEPTCFAYEWHPYAIEPDVDYSDEPRTLVEFRLEPVEAGTRLTVVESGFDALPAARRDIAFRMNDGGWTQQTKNIKAHVEA